MAIRIGQRRRGVTLVELLISLAIMGIMAGVATMAVRRIAAPVPDDPYHIVADSLRRAVETGRPAVVKLVVGGAAAYATVNPDGSVVADTVLHVERFTGRPVHAR
jgi:prepilin-type N-terminal cleavage/methylation domain-containing protein